MTRVAALSAALLLLSAATARAQEAIPTAQRPAADAPAREAIDPVSTLDADHPRFDDRGPGPMIGPCGSTGPNARGDGPDHKAHGEVTAGAGTRGYREAGAVVCQPIGDDAAVTIAIDAGRIGGRRH
ncbi:MAG TPA: hypothetical protein VFC47_06400 [Caulobacteraceae bacterium]|nr:hypothetical protein [Caulobacteraceae bacterium]